MAKKRIIFEGNNVKYFPISNVGGDQFKVQAAFQGNLADRIDNVLKFSIGKVETDSKIRAYEYAAANPVSFSQYENASPTERTKLLPKGTNVFNSTSVAKKFICAFLNVELNTLVPLGNNSFLS